MFQRINDFFDDPWKVVCFICIIGIIGVVSIICINTIKHSLQDKYEEKFGSLNGTVLTKKIMDEFWYNGDPIRICKKNILFVESRFSGSIYPVLDENYNFISCSESEINRKFMSQLETLK